MKKSTYALFIAESVFVILSLVLIVVLSYSTVDSFTDCYDRFLIYGFMYIPVFITGLCTIHIIWILCNKKTKKILSWVVVALSSIYGVYVLCSLLVIQYVTFLWFAFPIPIVLLWGVNYFTMVFKKK